MALDNIIAREQRFQRNALIAFVVIALIATLLYSLARGMMAGPADVAAAFTPATSQQGAIGAAALPNGAVAGTGVGGPVDALRRRPGIGGTKNQPGTTANVPGIQTPATGTETAGAGNTDPGAVGEPPVGQGFLPDTSGVGGGTGTGAGGVGSAGPGAGPIDGFSGAGGGGQTGAGPVDPTPPTDPENPTDPVTPTDPVPPVPEPLTWMMLILGVGMAGCALRRERARAALPALGAV